CRAFVSRSRRSSTSTQTPNAIATAEAAIEVQVSRGERDSSPVARYREAQGSSASSSTPKSSGAEPWGGGSVAGRIVRLMRLREGGERGGSRRRAAIMGAGRASRKDRTASYGAQAWTAFGVRRPRSK